VPGASKVGAAKVGASGSDSRKSIIDGISVRLSAGYFYGIIGPNGCGKTTLIDLLMGQLTPTNGKITYRGQDVSAIASKERARHMALVPQLYSVNFPFTVREVVTMGRYPHLSRFSAIGEADAAIIIDTMRATDTLGFSHRRINQLSGGERQRVVFARALAQQATVLFLDEATANLDINHTLALLKLATDRVKDGGTVISVFQEINLAAMFCDYLIFMENGRIMAHGPTQSVLTEAHLERLFGVSCRVEKNTFNNHLHVTFKV
jgi:iron complex transport system ATP-binding protein